MTPPLRRPAANRSRATVPPVPRPRSVQPDDLSGPAQPKFIWLTILITWLASLLPWRLLPFAPELLLLVIAFWAVNEPNRIGMLVAFALGLLMDVHDAGVLGGQALFYTLTVYGGFRLHRRLMRFNVWGQAVHMLPVFVAAYLLATVLPAWIFGGWPGWDGLAATGITVALWPLVGWLLQLPQRVYDVDDAAAS